MATKPAALPAPQMCLIKLNNMGWSDHILMSPSLLTRFAELMSLCSMAEPNYSPGDVQIVAVKGGVDYGVQSTTRKHILVPEAGVKEFTAYYKSTYELIPEEDRPPSGTPLLTWEEYKVIAATSTKES